MRARFFSIVLALSSIVMMGACGNSNEVQHSTVFQDIDVTPYNPSVQYTGRWNHDNAAAPRVAWSGSSVALRFWGDSISANLEGGKEVTQFRVVIDGNPQLTLLSVQPGMQTVSLASALQPNTAHTVELFKESNALGHTTLHGFIVHGAALEPPPLRPAKRLAFFGDSNMSGYSLYSEKDQGGMGTWYAFPAMVSRMLGAEMHLQSVAGALLAGDDANTVESFIYSRSWGKKDSSYRSGYEPDVIVVNAGANDIYTVFGAGQKETIKGRYKAVITELRNVFGKRPHIVLYNAYAWATNEPANYSHEVVAEVSGNLSVLLYPWTWEQWHGTMVEHAGQARLLAQHIVSLNLGFEQLNDADVFDGFGRNFDVANGSFEQTAADGYLAFGWRYYEDGAERIDDRGAAADGQFYIQLDAGEEVHQGIDATGDFSPGGTGTGQAYRVEAMIRAVGPAGGQAEIAADFEGQALYNRADEESVVFSVDSLWRQYSAVLTAPPGTWKTYISLRGISGVVDIDNVRVSAAQ